MNKIKVLDFDSATLGYYKLRKTLRDYFNASAENKVFFRTSAGNGQIEYLTYTEKGVKSYAHYVWRITIYKPKYCEYRKFNMRNDDAHVLLNRQEFIDWIKEDYPQSFEWLLFNLEWLA